MIKAFKKEYGWGVFAIEFIPSDEIIEICPVILFPINEIGKDSDATVLSQYPFAWSKSEDAFVLGYGSLYNHSYDPNAWYKRDFDEQVIKIISRKLIKAGEQITISYNGYNPDTGDMLPETEPLWFNVEKL